MPKTSHFRDGFTTSEKEIKQHLLGYPTISDVRIEDQAYDRDGELLNDFKAIYVKRKPEPV